jgi:predicted nucleic acid-binding protein
MAQRRWVVNASTLILSRKVERIQLLGALADQIAVPRGVNREVSAMPEGERTARVLTMLESAIIVDDEVPPTDILS